MVSFRLFFYPFFFFFWLFSPRSMIKHTRQSDNFVPRWHAHHVTPCDDTDWHLVVTGSLYETLSVSVSRIPREKIGDALMSAAHRLLIIHGS